jgi:hypothetical protein
MASEILLSGPSPVRIDRTFVSCLQWGWQNDYPSVFVKWEELDTFCCGPAPVRIDRVFVCPLASYNWPNVYDPLQWEFLAMFVFVLQWEMSTFFGGTSAVRNDYIFRSGLAECCYGLSVPGWVFATWGRNNDMHCTVGHWCACTQVHEYVLPVLVTAIRTEHENRGLYRAGVNRRS